MGFGRDSFIRNSFLRLANSKILATRPKEKASEQAPRLFFISQEARLAGEAGSLMREAQQNRRRVGVESDG